MELDEILGNPAFWLLGGGAVAATMIGYIASQRMDWVALPIWQLIVLLIVEIIAAAFFATRE